MFKVLVDFYWLSFYIFDEFELSVCGEGCSIMKQFVKDESDCPDIAFGGVGF